MTYLARLTHTADNAFAATRAADSILTDEHENGGVTIQTYSPPTTVENVDGFSILISAPTLSQLLSSCKALGSFCEVEEISHISNIDT